MLLSILVSITFAVLQVPVRDNAAQSTGTASIGGRVTDKESGRPLSGAIVRLSAADQSAPRRTETDADGRYEFTELPAGEYALMVRPGGFRVTHLAQMFGESSPLEPASHIAAPRFELAEGEKRTKVDVALIRALAIEGTVVDLYGEPLAEIDVRALRVDRPGSEGFWGISTDDRGVFRIFALAPGEYRICATPGMWRMAPMPDSAPDRFVRTCYPAALTDDEARRVVVKDSDVVGIEIRLQRSSTYSLSGIVLDSSGRPADEARLDLNRLDGGGRGIPVKNGQFVARGLTPGEYHVRASVGGPADPGDRRPPKRELEQATLRVRIDTTDVSGVVLSTTKGARVNGHVIFDGEARPPRPQDLRVVVQMSADRSLERLEGRPVSAPVKEDLTFELSGLWRSRMVGVHGLPAGWVVKSVLYRGQDVTNTPVEFTTGPDIVEIVLTNRPAYLSVRVVDDQGRLVSACQVVVLSANSQGWRTLLYPLPKLEKRVFDAGARGAGDYLVAALAPEDFVRLQRERSLIDEVAAMATRVSLKEDESRVIDIGLAPMPRPY